MATSWKFKLYVNNATGKKLSVTSKNLNWGYWDLNDVEDREPIDIEPNTSQEVLGIKAARGTWTGYECSCVWSNNEAGTLSLYIDVPFSADNESRLSSNGLLRVENWSDLPSSGHAFTRLIDVSLVGGNLAVTNDIIISDTDTDDDGYCNYLDQQMSNNDIVNDWEKLKAERELEEFDPLAELPDTYKYPPKILIGHTPAFPLSKSSWDGIGDPVFENLYQKQQCVEEYFAVGIYTLNTNPRVNTSIAAGVETAEETTVEVTSSIKNTLTTHYSIKNSLTAKGTVPKISLEVSNTLEAQFSITNVKENSSSKLERTTKTVKIGASDKNRMFVQWLFSEAVAIYRKRKPANPGAEDKIELIAISEWPIMIANKVYEYK